VTTEDGTALTLVPHLDKVLPELPADLHPVAVAGFLLTPQTELARRGRPRSVHDWLNGGGAVEQVLQLIELNEWACS
jgi:hypothetical protein